MQGVYCAVVLNLLYNSG